MLLTQKDIDELKGIYRAKYDRELPDDKAWEMGNRLIRIYSILTGVTVMPKSHERKVCIASDLTDRQGTP